MMISGRSLESRKHGARCAAGVHYTNALALSSQGNLSKGQATKDTCYMHTHKHLAWQGHSGVSTMYQIGNERGIHMITRMSLYPLLPYTRVV
eukprot:5790251-Amphidinium_carterae.1